jgi:DNA repair photolyase
MPRRTVFIPYSPQRIVNRHRRPDHWFWTRYSAYPYLGCQHGCEFCYCRERKYAPYSDVDDFAHVIKVKQNAPDLLRRELARLPADVVFTGDYQPAERLYTLSRQMLAVCRDLGFPVFVLERSPLVTRDLDLLQDIQARAAAIVGFSLITTPDSPNAARVRQLERLTPAPARRFQAMQQVSRAGLVAGACFMPVLPGLCDDPATIDNVVRWTAEHGGQFVLCGGLTLADQQHTYFFDVLQSRFPDLLPLYQRLYPPGSYAAAGWPALQVARQVRAACQRYGLRDRIPRPIIAGEKRALNKRVAEALADKCYTLELEAAPPARVWAYRKAAWAVEALDQELGLFYRRLGLRGLAALPDLGPELAPEVAALIQAHLPTERTLV